MRDFFITHIERRQTSRFDGQPYYELEIVGVDPYDKHLKLYKTYVVRTYQNFKHWQEILNKRTLNYAIWFSGNIKFKGFEKGIEIINADSKPRYENIVALERLERFFQHNMNIGAIKNTGPEIEFSDLAKQFFDVGEEHEQQ